MCLTRRTLAKKTHSLLEKLKEKTMQFVDKIYQNLKHAMVSIETFESRTSY